MLNNTVQAMSIRKVFLEKKKELAKYCMLLPTFEQNSQYTLFILISVSTHF